MELALGLGSTAMKSYQVWIKSALKLSSYLFLMFMGYWWAVTGNGGYRLKDINDNGVKFAGIGFFIIGASLFYQDIRELIKRKN